MSNEEYTHQDFWTKVTEKLNQEQEPKTWMQQQEDNFKKQLIKEQLNYEQGKSIHQSLEK